MSLILYEHAIITNRNLYFYWRSITRYDENKNVGIDGIKIYLDLYEFNDDPYRSICVGDLFNIFVMDYSLEAMIEVYYRSENRLCSEVELSYWISRCTLNNNYNKALWLIYKKKNNFSKWIELGSTYYSYINYFLTNSLTKVAKKITNNEAYYISIPNLLVKVPQICLGMYGFYRFLNFFIK